VEIGPLSNRRPLPITRENQVDRQEGIDTGKGPGDVIEISFDGRQKLAELADAALKTELPVSDSENRIRRIRERIDSGFYDQAEIRRTIADRIIDDMDI